MTRLARHRFAADTTRGWCVLSLAYLCAGCEPENEVKWRVRFACEQAASDVVRVRVRILSLDCDGEPIYEAELPREGYEAGDVDPPGQLPSGSHGFEATSLNDSGEIISTTCRVVDASARGHVELLLPSSRCEASEADGGLTDVGPVPAANCLPGTSVAQDATATRDRVCTPCTNGFSAELNAAECTPWSECGEDEIELLAGTAIHDRVCGLPGDCAPGTYDSGAPSTSTKSARVCMACPAGTFSDRANARACTPFKTCGSGQEQAGAGSATADVECQDVDGCAEADPMGDANPCNTQNGNAACIDTPAPGTGYTCSCSAGFEPSEGTCLPVDACPNDPNKTAPGACGCGTPEVIRDGLVECPVLTDGFEGGGSNWFADGNWRIQSPAEAQPPDSPSSNRVAHASGCSYCELISREIPTAGAKKLTLTFKRYVDSELDVDSGEFLELWVYSQGSRIPLKQYSPPSDNDDQWHQETFDLTTYAADDMRIGFAASTGLSSEDIEVDDVVLIMNP